MSASDVRAIIRDWWNDCCRKGAIFREHMGSPDDRSRLFDELATRISAAEAELAARSEETLIDRDVGMEVIYLGRCDDGLPYLVGPGRYAIRPLPDAKPEPVAVWERPEHAGAPYMCSACSTPLCEGHLGGMCPICALPLASTPSPWPGTTDELAAQERAAKGG